LKIFSKIIKNLLTNSKNGAIMHYTDSERGKNKPKSARKSYGFPKSDPKGEQP
jgi:hypothetical protein